MNHPELPPRVRGILFGWRVPGTAAGALACLALACGRGGVVEVEAPSAAPTARLLELAGVRQPGSEVLHASVDVFGIEIATLDSSLCHLPSGGAVASTRVEAAPLVKVIRKTGGEASTQLPEPGQLPRSSEYTFRDGDLIRHYAVDYRPGSYAYVYDNGGVERRVGTDDVPEGAFAHDLHSGLLLLRSWRPRLGEEAYFYTVLGRRPWRVDVTSRGVEMIKIGDDARLTYRIDGVAVRLWQPESAQPKRFSLWLSEEADRVPLRMVADASFGQVTMNLTGREPGSGACSPSRLAQAERSGQLPVGAPAPAGVIGDAWASPPADPASASPERD
jgi:hypothetical protein